MNFTTNPRSKPVDEQRLQEIVGAAVESAFSLLNLKPDDAWEIRYLDLERQRLAALVREWLQFERGREDFRKVRHQQEIRFQLAGLDMRGLIDRLDRLPDGSLVVIDYKTGSQSYRAGDWSTPRPARPQLPLYATALLGTPGTKLSAVAFASVNRGGCRMAGAARSPRNSGSEKLARPGVAGISRSMGPGAGSAGRGISARRCPHRPQACAGLRIPLDLRCDLLPPARGLPHGGNRFPAAGGGGDPDERD